MTLTSASVGRAQACVVTVDSLVPIQHPAGKKFQTACFEFRQQRMLKHPYLSEFHSRAEHFHAGLLEGDPSVLSYVPQPFELRIGKRRYKPDCYIVQNGRRRVVELKPKGEMKVELVDPLRDFFALQGMEFELISNESVLERSTEALNWLEITRVLIRAENIDSSAAERAVLECLATDVDTTLGDLIDSGDRERTFIHEVAVFRLLHRGLIHCDALVSCPLDFDVGFRLCT